MKYGVLNWWKQFLFFGICLYEGDPNSGGGSGEGGEGGEGGDDKVAKSDVDKLIADAVNKAVGGLKTKNSELIGETKKLADRLKAYGDMDPDKVREMMDKLDKQGEADLLKDGKIDELVQKRVDKIVVEKDAIIDELKKGKQLSDEKLTASDKRYNNRVVSEEIMKTAIEAGVRKEALDDIVVAARSIFTVGDDDEVEARDKDGNLRKIGDKLFTPDNWIDSLRETKPHYWPESAGAGAQGNKGDRGGASGDLSAKIEAAAAAGDMVEFRRLRKQQQGKK